MTTSIDEIDRQNHCIGCSGNGTRNQQIIAAESASSESTRREPIEASDRRPRVIRVTNRRMFDSKATIFMYLRIFEQSRGIVTRWLGLSRKKRCHQHRADDGRRIRSDSWLFFCEGSRQI